MKSEEVPFEQYVSELPHHVLSYIFSKLSVKDLVKTSTLSKQWCHEYQRLLADLNFDLQNVFDNIIIELPKSFPLFKGVQSQFAERVDQFMLHYEGALIRSLRVNFPLDDEQSDVIGRLISHGIAKGVERIELLFSFKAMNFEDLMLEITPYKFSFTLLSDTNSLKHLHLQNCLLVATMQFSGFKNLRTLVLHLVTIERAVLQGLLSNCIHLLDLTLDECVFDFVLTIISSSLCHLNILNYDNGYWRRIDIVASNLSSFEFSSFNRYWESHTINIVADKLSKFRYKDDEISEVVGFYALKNITTIVLDGVVEKLDEIAPRLFSECLQLEDVTFKNCKVHSEVKITCTTLRHLNIIDCGPWSDSEIYINALNLSSFDYSGPMTIASIKAPKLLKVFWNATEKERIPWPLDLIASLHQLESLAMVMSHSKIATLPKVMGPFQNLRQLEFFLEEAYDPDSDYFWILDIAMVSPHLQEFSLTIKNSHLKNSHMITLQRQRREYAGFFHSELKCVELHGCVCTINVIELASHFLRKVNSLKKITFRSCDKFYIGAGRWTDSSGSCGCFERNLIHGMLKDEINEECQLIIL